MSDSEEILDDIRALEYALASQSASRNSTPTDSSSSFVPGTLEIEEESLPNSTVNETTPSTVFNLNTKLLALMYAARDEVSVLLEECNQKLALIEERLAEHTKLTVSSKIMLTTAGMPYFKDRNHFSAGPNEDTKLKALRKELQVVALRKVCRWTPKDRDILMKSIKEEAAYSSALLAQEDTKKFSLSLDSLVNGTLEKSGNTCTKLSNEFKDMVGPLGTKEYDWLKIAAVDFDGKHSADECRVMWNVFLHPDINKGKWSEAEDLKMKKLAEKYKFQNWETIASELNTKRSGYQCFIRYNTTKSIKDLRCRPWTPEECQSLSKVVNELRLGNYVPWGEVAECMFQRVKQQVYFRWKYSSAPHLKKGRFTEEEDRVLLKAVKKYGVNFSKIAVTLLPHRTTIQLNDHYHTLLSRTKNSNVWTVSDDTKLLKLYNELGPDWSKISKILVAKSRTQVRHRYTAVSKFLKKGMTIANLPRRTKTEISTLEYEEDDYPDETMYDEVDNVDDLLLQHFCCLELSTNCYVEETFSDMLDLQDITKKLYKLLQYLGANLNIPNNFNNIPLSDSEKYILRSLKEYDRVQNDEARRRNIVERLRLKMFGSQNDRTEKEHFIPSYPSESKVRKEDLITEKIDYDLHMNNCFTIEILKEIETPDNVTACIDNNNQLEDFQKISNLLLSRHYNFLAENMHNISATTLKSQVDQHNMSDGNIKREMSNEGVSVVSPIRCLNVLQEKGLKFMQHCRRVVAASRARVDADKPLYTVHFEICSGIEPDIVTLVAFKNLFSLKQLHDIEVAADPVTCKQPAKCQNANNVLKKRLIQLFKYPIVMSHNFVPQVYVDFLNNSKTNSKKRKASKSADTRRKKIKVEEISTYLPPCQ